VPLVGVHFQGSKQVGTINALTAGFEVFRDEAIKLQLKRDSIEGNATRAGVLVGHEFLLGKFIFSQRLGVYVFSNTPYFNRLNHRWGIQYRINQNFSMGVHLNAHKQVAEFVDLRLSYSF
jgi:hypothetical protein